LQKFAPVKQLKRLSCVWVFTETHLRVTGRHLTYEITHDTSERALPVLDLPYSEG